MSRLPFETHPSIVAEEFLLLRTTSQDMNALTKLNKFKEGLDFAILFVHVVASTNRFVDENFSLSFYNEQEIDSWLEVLSSKNIEKVMLENADYDTSTDKRTVDDNLFH